MQPLTTIPPNQRTLQTRQNKKQENWQKAFCIIGGESRGIRISSRNNERIKTTNKNDGKINKKLQDWFCIKLYTILVPNLLHFYLYGFRNLTSTKPYFQIEEITKNFSCKIQNPKPYFQMEEIST